MLRTNSQLSERMDSRNINIFEICKYYKTIWLKIPIRLHLPQTIHSTSVNVSFIVRSMLKSVLRRYFFKVPQVMKPNHWLFAAITWCRDKIESWQKQLTVDTSKLNNWRGLKGDPSIIYSQRYPPYANLIFSLCKAAHYPLLKDPCSLYLLCFH